MKIVSYPLSIGNYYKEEFPKHQIYIHHTAGGHRPDWTIDGWEHDRTKKNNKLAVGTAYVIGGKSISDGDVSYNGTIYQAFDSKYWAHHLGLKISNNLMLNTRSIGIELCNYGPLVKSSKGLYLNYVGKVVPPEDVVTLKTPYRGYLYYHKYTDAQITSLALLLKYLGSTYNIDLQKGMIENKHRGSMYEISRAAMQGKTGVWTHSNVRSDKFDCSPQPALTALLSYI